MIKSTQTAFFLEAVQLTSHIQPQNFFVKTSKNNPPPRISPPPVHKVFQLAAINSHLSRTCKYSAHYLINGEIDDGH